MQEYHVDCHPGFATKYVSSDINKKFGGNLSIHKPVDCHPKLLIGQDKCIIKENLFSAKQWTSSEGQNMFWPKDERHAWMLSAFILQAWSFDIAELLCEDKLGEINVHRQHYISTNSAIEANHSTAKQNQGYITILQIF